MSGYAAAIAFGAVFVRRGFLLGTARVAFRTWQVYTAHLTLFFIIVAVSAAATYVANPGWGTDGFAVERWGGTDYIGKLNLWYFFDETPRAIVGLFTLSYVPNFFDILPMYLVLLAMMPLVVGLSMIRPWAGPAFCLALWLVTWTVGTGLPAEVRPDSDRVWFFNPFGWHIVFFTGFCIQMGWLKVPPRSVWLVALCLAFIVFAALVSNRMFYAGNETLTALRAFVAPLHAKTDQGIFRYLHFLAIAYVTVVLLYGREQMLLGRLGRPIAPCGRPSLPVFMFSMILSRLAGMALDLVGREVPVVIAVNAAGIAILIGFAYLLGWLKSEPWRARRPAAAPAKRPAPG